ncbi:MAG: winged helix-turn-helix transcriptional regulator [Synergistaceae bacterium]|nr:winged helix-turn-helix transcriptional regulator [Synergistaceae bacterium]MBP9626319.1 winged helix-turn-helix transcriptional regulator [Synergistaceae bacterium]
MVSRSVSPDYSAYSVVFKVMSDDTRLKILDILSCGELCACKILENLHITQPTLSYHMKLLCDCGLVRSRKEGSWIHYWIHKDRVADIALFMDTLLNEKENCICFSEEGLH